jgi:hypothetical protein
MVATRAVTHIARLGVLAVILGLVSLLLVATPVAAVEADLVADLSGAAEVPGPGDPDGTGTAWFYLDSEAGELCYALFVENIAAATAAHIHPGAAGEANPPAITLEAPAGGSSGGCVAADPGLLGQIAANPAAYYVNVHNADYPAGAVRGQLAASAAAEICFLIGAVNPGPETEGSTTLAATTGETVTFWGYFFPDASVDLWFFFGEEGAGGETITADAEGYIEFDILFETGDEGDWLIVAGIAETICEGSVAVTVTAAATPTPTPTATPAPSSPTPTPAPPAALPDTAVVGSEGWIGSALLALLLAAAAAWGTILLQRQRK